MGRIHLFEFEDLPWFPVILRHYGTDFLQFISNHTPMYDPAIPLLESMLTRTGICRIVDLGSGSGGGLLRLNEKLKRSVPGLKIMLTDYYPNIKAFEQARRKVLNFEYSSSSIDARHVPDSLKGVRTLFLAFHHFKRRDARMILENAVATHSPIALFESQERSARSIMSMLFSPLTVWFTTPFIRPFRFWRIVLTYLIPVVPFFILWDGVVSCLRTYSVKEMNRLIAAVPGNKKFEWNTGRMRSGPGVILYLTGIPKVVGPE